MNEINFLAFFQLNMLLLRMRINLRFFHANNHRELKINQKRIRRKNIFFCSSVNSLD